MNVSMTACVLRRQRPGPWTKPTADVSGLLMSAQSGRFHWKVGLERAVDDALGDVEVGGAPVEVGDAQADLRRVVAGAHEVVGDGPDRLAGGGALPGDGQGLGRVDAADDDVSAAVDEVVASPASGRA